MTQDVPEDPNYDPFTVARMLMLSIKQLIKDQESGKFSPEATGARLEALLIKALMHSYMAGGMFAVDNAGPPPEPGTN